MQIIQKKGGIKNYFVINICEKLNHVNIKYVRFCLYQWKWGFDFMFQKSHFENFKKWEIFLIFSSFL